MANSRHAFFGETTYLFENNAYVSGKIKGVLKNLFNTFSHTTKNPLRERVFCYERTN